MKLLLLLIVVLLIVGSRSGYSSNVTCLSPEETNAFLAADADGFVASLNRWDLFARKVSSTQEYLDKISKSGVACHVSSELTSRADAIFRSKGDDAIADQPWIIAMTDGSYEEGYPHTRRNIIFLSGPVDVDTLVHEKLHIWHRYSPPDLASMGFKYLGPRKGTLRLRSNPDVDPYIYEGFGKPMVALYNSDRPMNISDVDSEPKFEHPLEYLAYSYLH